MAQITISLAGDCVLRAISVPPWRGDAAALRTFYQSALARAAKDGLSALAFSLPAEPPLSQTATVALHAVMDFLLEQPPVQQVHLLCPTDSTATLYRQTYNLWYAEDKAGRL